MPPKQPLHLALALDGAGWHPAAWRAPDARPAEVFTAGYWVDLAREAEAATIDFLTIEDSLSLQSTHYGKADGRTDQVRGRLDAVLVASRIAPATTGIGLVPSVTVTHTEPFHVSKAIATLDYVSTGRAGVRVQVSGRAQENAHFGRRQLGIPAGANLRSARDTEVEAALAELFDEAADYVEVIRRLWDSWEDDAEIRDVRTGRFVDRDKLHYIDFEGRWFSVKGPSITPRPPQAQPVVAALAHQGLAYRLVGRSADIGFVTPANEGEAGHIIDQIRDAQRVAGRGGETVHVFADLVVFLDENRSVAKRRRHDLDDLAGAEYSSDALIFAGDVTELADLLEAWREAGLTGFRLWPGAIPHDLQAVTRSLVTELRRRGVFPHHYEHTNLRARLDLPRPANRYAA